MASLHLLSLGRALEAPPTEMSYYQCLMQIRSSIHMNYHGKPGALTAPLTSAPTPRAAPACPQHCTALPALLLPTLLRSLPAAVQELIPTSQQHRNCPQEQPGMKLAPVDLQFYKYPRHKK